MSTIVNQLLKGLILKDPEVGEDGAIKNSIARRLLDSKSAARISQHNTGLKTAAAAQAGQDKALGEAMLAGGMTQGQGALAPQQLGANTRGQAQAADFMKRSLVNLPENSLLQSLIPGNTSYRGDYTKTEYVPSKFEGLPDEAREVRVPGGPITPPTTRAQREQAILAKSNAMRSKQAAEQTTEQTTPSIGSSIVENILGSITGPAGKSRAASLVEGIQKTAQDLVKANAEFKATQADYESNDVNALSAAIAKHLPAQVPAETFQSAPAGVQLPMGPQSNYPTGERSAPSFYSPPSSGDFNSTPFNDLTNPEFIKQILSIQNLPFHKKPQNSNGFTVNPR